MDLIKRVLSCILLLGAKGGSLALKTCSPAANVAFDWNYDTVDSRQTTVWSYNGQAIMAKYGEDKAEDLNITQFIGRIAEHEGSNAGIVIHNLSVADSGQYNVKVRFTMANPFTASEELDVDPTAVPTEINANKEITVDGRPLETDKEQVIGNPKLNFTFSIKGACIALPDVIMQFETQQGKSQTKQCKQEFVCSETYEEAGNISVTVIVAGYGSDLRFPSVGFYEIQDIDAGSNVQCKDRMGCIVPATVVPVSVVVIVIIILLVVFKPCRR